jgi:hypothetical protein
MRLRKALDIGCRAYRELFRYQIPEHDVHLIANASEYCHTLGDDRIRRQIEQKYGISLGRAMRERPRKDEANG